MLAQNGPDCTKDHLVDVVGYLGARFHRMREGGVENATFRRRDMDGAKEPFIVGNARGQRTLEGIHGPRIGDVVDAVDSAFARLGRGARVIDVDV